MDKKKTVMKGLGMAGKFAFQDDGTLHPRAHGAVERLLSVQRPVVIAYLRSLRRRHPDATPAEIAHIVSQHYLVATTGGGAAVGAAAVVPGIGTGVAVAVAAAETAGFLEGSALYAQALSELHGLPVRDPERANALVMGLMLGSSGADLVKQFAGQAQGGQAVNANWGSLVAKQIPNQVLDTVVKRMRKMMVRKFAAKGAGSFVGRVLPFGVGAIVGGVVNHQMAKSVVTHADTAFGPIPTYFEKDLDPKTSTPKKDADLMAGLRNFIELAKKRGGGITDVIPGEVLKRTGRKGRKSADDDAPGALGDRGASGARDAADRAEDAPDDDAPRTYRPDVRL
ncbi:hypothetical protein [Brevibacterium samyangense]|uniref:EcsC protein family protein n=1 Tax=Brevibacterium samyangense TaxID=366888 RepID=A0ABN2TNW7_9MICO